MPKTATSAAGGAVPAKYDLDDLQSDLGHLAHLIAIGCDTVVQAEGYVLADGRRNRDLDRVNALMWIARDLIERIDAQVEENFDELRDKVEAPA